MLCCVPEPWPERGSTVRWPTCCREWSMCLNISTSTWAYPRSDSFLRGNQKAHAQILTYQWCVHLHKVIPFFLLGVAPCSSLHGLFSEQHGCKNSSLQYWAGGVFHLTSCLCKYSQTHTHIQYSRSCKRTQEGNPLNSVRLCQHFLYGEKLDAYFSEGVFVSPCMCFHSCVWKMPLLHYALEIVVPP